MFQMTPEQAGMGINVNWNSRIIGEFIEKEFGKKMKKETYVLAKVDKKIKAP